MEVLIALIIGAAACFTVLTGTLLLLADRERSESGFESYEDGLSQDPIDTSDQDELAMRLGGPVAEVGAPQRPDVETT